MELLMSAYRAMEPASEIIRIAREIGGGCLNDQVQQIFLDKCLRDEICLKFPPSSLYIKNVLKKLILTAEAEACCVLDSLYEEHAAFLKSPSLDDEQDAQVYKTYSYDDKHITIRVSLNMLEGDTGCYCWPAGLYLAEVVLSFPQLIRSKRCLELGSGAGLLGICLARSQPAHVRIISGFSSAFDLLTRVQLKLTDGDLSTLDNLQHNFQINGVPIDGKTIECERLVWEEDLSAKPLALPVPYVIFGADVVYDPSCVPHLVRVLVHFLADARSEAFIATVKRNPDTMSSFLQTVNGAGLTAVDVTRTMVPSRRLQGLASLDRSTVILHRIAKLV